MKAFQVSLFKKYIPYYVSMKLDGFHSSYHINKLKYPTGDFVAYTRAACLKLKLSPSKVHHYLSHSSAEMV